MALIKSIQLIPKRILYDFLDHFLETVVNQGKPKIHAKQIQQVFQSPALRIDNPKRIILAHFDPEITKAFN